MLTVSSINLNTRNDTNKQDVKPAFKARLEILPDAFQAVESAFSRSRKSPLKGMKYFVKNMKEAYKHFGFDGVKCLFADSFKSKANYKKIAEILTSNTEAATSELPGRLILTQEPFNKVPFGNVHITEGRNNLYLYYKPVENGEALYTACFDRPAEQYFPPYLSLKTLNRAVCNISHDAEEGLLTSCSLEKSLQFYR